MTTAKAAELGARRLSGAIGLKLGAEGLGRVAQFGTLALAARTLGLADFGRYGLALTVGFLLAQLADFGLHLNVTRRLSRADQDASAFVGRALTTKLGLLAVLTGLAGLLAIVFGGSAVRPFWGLVESALLYSVAEFAFAVLRARRQLPLEAGLVILHRVSLLLGAGLTFLSGAGLVGLTAAHLVAGGLVAAGGWRVAGLKAVGRFDWRLLKASLPIGLAIFLSLLAFKVDVPLLQWLNGRADEVGLYNAAYRLFEPVLLFPAAIMAGLFPGLARAGQVRADAGFRRQTGRLLAGLGGAGLMAGAGLAVVAPWLVTFLYGGPYAPAGPTLQLLAVAVPFLFVNSGLTHLLLAVDRERYNLYFFGASLALNVGLNWLLIPALARDGAALATGLTEASLSLMTGTALFFSLKPASQGNILTRSARLGRLGFGGLLALVVALPFEFNQQPWLNLGGWLTLNNLKLLFYAVIGLAVATLWVERRQLRFGRRWPGWWLAGLLLICAVSTVFSTVPRESLKFTFDLGLGSLLWLAVPFWFVPPNVGRLNWLKIGLVSGATLSAGLGLLEFVPGLGINQGLLRVFKAGATIAGPFLRLSGTFEYANTAAMYYELVLPFALVGLIEAARSAKTGWQSWLVVGAWLVAVGVLWEALILSFSRAALPGMLVALPVLAWAGRGYWREQWRGLGLALGLGVGLIALSLLFSPTLLLRFKTQSDQGWYRASYTSSLPTSLAACGEISTPVTVHNMTPLDWSPRTYRLAYHWLDRPDHVYLFEGVQTLLPAPLKAGQASQVMARLVAPARPGSYLLVWDVLQTEGNLNWFSLKSAAYQTQPVEITPGSSACTDPLPAAVNLDSLPTAPPNPERAQLWKVAGQMIAARPWLGVGPDGYRFNYGRYANQMRWDERIFANSLPLELAADLGIPGAVCFAVFVGLVMWPLVRQGWRGRLSLASAAVLAASVAFGLHGLLDYFLGFHAIFILFWLLLALARLESHPVSGGEA